MIYINIEIKNMNSYTQTTNNFLEELTHLKQDFENTTRNIMYELGNVHEELELKQDIKAHQKLKQLISETRTDLEKKINECDSNFENYVTSDELIDYQKEISMFRHSQRDNAKQHELSKAVIGLRSHFDAKLEHFLRTKEFDDKMSMLDKENQYRYKGLLNNAKDIETVRKDQVGIKNVLSRKIEKELVTNEYLKMDSVRKLETELQNKAIAKLDNRMCDNFSRSQEIIEACKIDCYQSK